jgi:flagellar motor switch/type III secretory pathway protein FliN
VSGTAPAWLPIDVAARDEVQSAFGRALSDWSAQWFVRPPLLVTGCWATRHPDETCAGAAWKRPNAAVAVSCPARGAARLAGWALDADLQRAPRRPADRRLVRVFERALVDDLAARAEGALGVAAAPGGLPPPPLGPMGGVIVAISDEAGEELLRLAAPMEVLLPLCQASLPPPPPADRMGKVVQALSGADLTIEARLGVAKITVGDLRGLAPGDILMMEQDLTEAVEVFLAGTNAEFARGKLLDLDGQLSLTLKT